MFLLKLKSFFEEEVVVNIKTEISKSYLDRYFISEVSNYVYDMRTVINICNEFKLYNEILKIDKPNIDKNKLFAIIFYKNIYPDDFARIQKNESKLHRIFKKDFKNDKELEKVILEIEEKLKKEIEEKVKLEKELSDLIIRDVAELRNIYIFNLIAMIVEKHDVEIIDIEELKLDSKLITDDNFQKIKTSSNIKYSYKYSSDNYSNISFKEVENKVNIKSTYDTRENLIKSFRENKIGLLERRILYLKNEKQNIKNLSLLELYQNYYDGIEEFLDLVYSSKIYNNVDGKEFEYIKLNPNIGLFKYLFINDYLNEDFIEYVSYFYPGSLSSNDHKLMMKINQNEFTSFDEKIDNVENLVKSTRDIRFKNQSILIYDIFYFLLKDCQEPSLRNKKLDFLLSQIQNYNDNSTYFLEGFFEKISDNNEILSNFYIEITKWDNFWNLVEVKFSKNFKRVVLFDLIQLFSDDIGDRTLIKLNKNKGMTKYINSDENFLKDIFDRISINQFTKTLMLLEVKFELINPDKKIEELLIKIYENNLYQINIDNLKLFAQVDKKYDYKEEHFSQANFTFLKSKTDTILYKRISSDLNQYIENVYLKIEENINENSGEVLHLLELKDEVISLENKLKIIQKGFNSKLEKFGEIQSKEVKSLLIEQNKISASWINIIEYYNHFGPLTPILTNYLNIEENFTKLLITELFEGLADFFKDKQDGHDFIYDLINDEGLTEDSFKNIFEKSGNLKLESNKITLESRILFLIEKDALKLDEDQFNFLLENNRELLIKLIEQNENRFISDLRDYTFDIDFIEVLLNSKLSIKNLNVIIDFKESNIMETENLKLLNRIARFYNENKLEDFSLELFEKLVFSALDEGYRIGLFNMYFSNPENQHQISDILEKMEGKFKGILENEDVVFDINDEIKNFLTIIKENELINSFRRDNKKGSFILTYA
ncbi:hypothetical protein LXH21_14460 [Flavobacterium algicola]|nr:hypothetical protein [Flavobacterium algicola]MCG9793674.1 hypothetical protein [Flavobacterium algicola]